MTIISEADREIKQQLDHLCVIYGTLCTNDQPTDRTKRLMEYVEDQLHMLVSRITNPLQFKRKKKEDPTNPT